MYKRLGVFHGESYLFVGFLLFWYTTLVYRLCFMPNIPKRKILFYQEKNESPILWLDKGASFDFPVSFIFYPKLSWKQCLYLFLTVLLLSSLITDDVVIFCLINYVPKY